MKTIDKQKLQKLMEKGALLVDVRSPIDFRDSHVTGAVNLPLKNFVNKITGMVKTSKIIIYSNSSSDTELKQSINYAENLGFTNLYIGEYQTLKD